MRRLWAIFVLSACGGVEAPVGPPIDHLALIVRDDLIPQRGCEALPNLGVEAELEVTGVLGRCRVSLKEDGAALSICERIPGRQNRELALTYYLDKKNGRLDLSTASLSLDLSTETREMIEVDFARATRVELDTDRDGTPNLDELCSGRDPTDPNG